MNILKKADEIINQRSEEKDRQYGPINEGMEKASRIASEIRNKEINAHDMYACMMALKLSRQSYNFKEDNLLDLVAYTGAWQNYIHTQPIFDPLIKPFKDLYEKGDYITVRNLPTKELLNYTFTLQPYQRFFNFPSRNLNIDYIKREFKWYLKGDPKDLSIVKYASLWGKLVNEDGTINSNYGQYIMPNIERIINTLIEDPYSRRAIIMIGNNKNFNMETKDYTCTLSLTFMIRNNKLNMYVVMRSNDLIFGLCNDVPAFSFFQELIYTLLKEHYPELQLGVYEHTAQSLHVYERHFKMLEKIVNNNEKTTFVDCPKMTLESAKALILELESNELFNQWLNH